MSQHDIVQKLWNLCDILRDDGINYSDYVTELVLLLFIKMVHENQEAGLPEAHPLPEGCRWSDLTGRSGLVLLNHYRHILLMLSTGKDGDKIVHEDPLVMAIYANAQTRLREPRHLEQMIRELDKIDWFSAQKDGLGDLYEGLLEKKRQRNQIRRRPVFHPARLNQHHGACREAAGKRADSRPRRRYRRLSDCRRPIHEKPQRQLLRIF